MPTGWTVQSAGPTLYTRLLNSHAHSAPICLRSRTGLTLPQSRGLPSISSLHPRPPSGSSRPAGCRPGVPCERRCLSHPLLAPGSCSCGAASLRRPVRPSRNLPLCPEQPPAVPSETEAEAEEDCPAGVGRFAGTPRPFLTQILLHLSPLSRPPQRLKTQSQPSVTPEGPFPKESALSHECTSPVFLQGQPSDSTRSQLACSRPTRAFLEQSTQHAYETPSPLCSGSRLT